MHAPTATPNPHPGGAQPQRGNVARVYLPPDANTLLSVADHCFRSRSYVNLIVIDKQPQLQWLDMDQAIEHCRKGAGIWEWAGTDDGDRDPDIVRPRIVSSATVTVLEARPHPL